MMDILLSVLAVSSETISGVYFFGALLKRKISNKWFNIIVSFQLIVTFVFVEMVYDNLTLLAFKLFALCLLLFFTLSLLYKGNVFIKIFSVVCFMIFITVFDILVTTMFMYLFDLSQKELYDIPPLWLFVTFVSKTLLFTFSYFFREFYGNKENFHKGNYWVWCMVLIIPIFTILSINTSIQVMLESSEMSVAVFFNAIGLFAVNVILVTLLDKISLEQQLRTENIIYQKEIQARMETAHMWMETIERQKSIAHDFNHHIDLINQLLQNNQLEDAKNHLKQFSITTTGSMVIDTNNPAINAVLNQKYWLAKEKGIGMRFMVNDLSCFPIPQIDMVTILSNLIDNAIEANEKTENKKNIIIKIMTSESDTILSIRNTAKPVLISGNTIETTKKNPSEHGFGLKNTINALSKYGFKFAIDYKNGWFHFSAMLL